MKPCQYCVGMEISPLEVESITMELMNTDVHQLRHLFEPFAHHLSVRGVLTGELRGKIYLSDDGRSAMLDNAQRIFIGGSPDNPSFFARMNAVLGKSFFPVGLMRASWTTFSFIRGRSMGECVSYADRRSLADGGQAHDFLEEPQ